MKRKKSFAGKTIRSSNAVELLYVTLDLVYFTIWVPDTSDTSATRATPARQEWDKNDRSATRVWDKRHGCDICRKFNKDTTENVFLHHYISYMTNERLQEEERFHSKNYVLEILCSYAKMSSTSALQKLNFWMAKAISKSYIQHCSCKYLWTLNGFYWKQDCITMRKLIYA